MQIIILFAVIITRSIPGIWPEPASWSVLSVAIGLYLGSIALIGILDRHFARDLLELKNYGPRQYAQAWEASEKISIATRRHSKFVRLQRMFLIFGITALNMLGFAQKVQIRLDEAMIPTGRLPLVEFILVISPVVAALIIIWLLDYPFHQVMRASVRCTLNSQAGRLNADQPVEVSTLGLWDYLVFNFRSHFLFVAAPVCVAIFLADCVDIYLAHYLPEWHQAFLILALVLLVLLIAPLMLVRVWKTRSLEPGDLRDEFEQMCAQVKVRARDIRVWESGGVLANAGALGILPKLRYILVSDGLINNLKRSEIRAVFAHEIAHIKHRHLLFLGIFAITSAMVSTLLGDLATWGVFYLNQIMPMFDSNSFDYEYVSTTVFVISMILIWWKIFGYFSRMFERQSDVAGAWMTCPLRADGSLADENTLSYEAVYNYADALLKVCELNGSSIFTNDWRHGTMYSRMEYLRSLAGKPGGRCEIDRKVKKIERIIFLALILSLVFLMLKFWLYGWL